MKKTLPQSLERRMLAYKKQASSYQQQCTHFSLKKDFRKGTLASLVTLAAVGMTPNEVQAQGCGMATMEVMSGGTSSGCPDIYFDLDGDNIADINIYFSGGSLYVRNLGTMPRVLVGPPQAGSFTAGAATMNNINVPSAPGNTFVIPLTMTMGGDIGFINITIDASGCPTITAIGVGPNSPVPANPVCSDLPVELTSFKANVEKNTIYLTWETATELENLGFELQRSTNGKDFDKIAWIAGAGTTLEAQRYKFKDEKVVTNQIYYYRLKQLNVSSSFEYSDIISVNLKDSTFISIKNLSPNPVTEATTLELESPINATADIQLYNTTGQLVKTYQFNIVIGLNNLQLELQNMPSGSYFVKIEIGGQRLYRKLVKQ